MTTTKKTTGTKRTTGTRKTATTNQASRAKTAPTAESAAAMDEGSNFVLSTLRSGFGAMEFGTLAVADLPMSVLNKVGVPKSATDAALSTPWPLRPSSSLAKGHRS
jgi:hypothetical protein